MFLSGITGSAVADASALGTVLIPSMTKEGYDVDFSTAVVASAATLGPIIPPSITMVVYGVTMNVSIGGLFLAGLIPGVIMGLAMMALIYYYARKRNYPKTNGDQPFARSSRAAGKLWRLSSSPSSFSAGSCQVYLQLQKQLLLPYFCLHFWFLRLQNA